MRSDVFNSEQRMRASKKNLLDEFKIYKAHLGLKVDGVSSDAAQNLLPRYSRRGHTEDPGQSVDAAALEALRQTNSQQKVQFSLDDFHSLTRSSVPLSVRVRKLQLRGRESFQPDEDCVYVTMCT